MEYSLIIQLSPIITLVSSLLYFKSCGFSPITTPVKISHVFPIFVPDFINTFECILVPSPIETLSSRIEYGPISTFSGICNLESTMEVGCIFKIVYVLLLTTDAKNVDSATNSFST